MATFEDDDHFVIPSIEFAVTALEDHIVHMVIAQLPQKAFHALPTCSLLTLRVKAGSGDDDAKRPQSRHSLDELCAALVVLVTPVQPQLTSQQQCAKLGAIAVGLV
ncbi:hypothetical protein [Nonomuraea sp. NPDC049480]|uniref:hypothetical protein n=1 Tax=Nonomuraea sp. NPDC049480 TaxID=3364353 RepID=UPI0037887925